MVRRYIWLLLMIAGLCPAAWGALEVATFYNGGSMLPGTLRLGEWGNAGTTDRTIPYAPIQVKTGLFGIPISTVGRYQGTRIDFTPPVDTRHMFNAEYAYLELYLRALKPTGRVDLMPALSNLRFTFFTQSGIGTFSVPASEFYPMEVVQDTWIKLDLPLCRINPSLKLGGTMSRMVITTDEPALFLLGRLAVVHELSALQANITVLPAVLETGKPIFFASAANGGLTACTVSWDFDEAAGASVDATGAQATYIYTNPGTYSVTCTVRDVNGEREAVTVTKEIKVYRARN